MKRVLVIGVAVAMMVSSWPVSAAGPASRPTGAIRGTAMSVTGQTLAYVTVPVRNLYTGQVAGLTTSDAVGGFNFAGLNPGSYIVEVVNQAGAIVGSSSVVTVNSGATATITVTTTAPAAFGAQAGAGTTQSHGVRTAVIITAIAAGAGIAAAIAIANNDSSPSR
jgi:hypothetical protein